MKNRFLIAVLGLVAFPIALLAKLLIAPFERPARKSASDVAEVFRLLIEGRLSYEAWDAFICVPIEERHLETLRQKWVEADSNDLVFSDYSEVAPGLRLEPEWLAIAQADLDDLESKTG